MSDNLGSNLIVPAGVFFADDAAKEKRQRIADAIRQGKEVSVGPTGEVDKDGIIIPKGTLA